MQRYAHWVILLAGLGLLILFPTRMADACPEQPYTFINPILVDTSSIYAPYALSFDNFEFPFLKEDHQTNENIQEWMSRYCDNTTPGDVYQVIYKTPVEDLEELRASIINKDLPMPIDLHGNTFAEANQKMGCTEVIDYLIFAKKCEPYVIASSDLWKQKDKNIEAIHQLMKEGGNLFKKTDSYFIRLRIAYQVIRLAHYAKEYHKVLELKDYFLPKIDKINSIINWWILGHVAGAELKTGKEVEAAYHFAQIFQNCPSKRSSAYDSFHIDNNKQWEKALLLCQSNDEKANLFAIRASQSRSRLVAEMSAIYDLNPKHPSLEPLLIKATKKMEAAFLGAEFHKNAQKKPPTRQQKESLRQLTKLVEKAIQDQTVNHLVLWKIVHGYLLILQGNWPEAEVTFAQINTQDPKLKKEIETIQTIIKINSYQHADTETESDLYNIMTNSDIYKNNPTLRAFLKERLAYLYTKDTLVGKALLMTHSVRDLKYNPDLAVLDELIKMTEKENPTRLEKTLIFKPDGTTIRSELLEIKVTLLLSQGQVEVAKEIYSLVPRAERSTKKFSPFAEDYLDCVFCPVTDTVAYSKSDLIDKLVEYDYKARADIQKGPDYFYLLGTAWYNMSFFGPAWHATDYFRSGKNWYFAYDDVYPLKGVPFGNKENHNLSKAKMYFSKALELAKDRDLQARSAYMLARIDQKEYFLSENCPYKIGSNLIPKLPPNRMIYYNLLIREYNDTEFYQDIIEECSFFAAYAK